MFAIAVAEGVVIIAHADNSLLFCRVEAIIVNPRACCHAPQIARAGVKEELILLAPARVERKSVVIDALVYKVVGRPRHVHGRTQNCDGLAHARNGCPDRLPSDYCWRLEFLVDEVYGLGTGRWRFTQGNG